MCAKTTIVRKNDSESRSKPLKEIQPIAHDDDRFLQFVGVAKTPPGFDSVAWVRDMRDDEYEAEQTRKRREAIKAGSAADAS